MSKSRFSPPRRVEVTYRHAIARLATRYLQTPEPGIFEELAELLARKMVTQVAVSNARSWREAAAKASRGREIYLALRQEMRSGIGHRVQELVNENARLISSIPNKVRQHLNAEIAEMQREGLRPETIQERIRKRIPQLTVNQAALIARTETSKAATALTRARSEDLGIGWYQWLSAEDSRVRPSHRLMDKVLCAWSDPPAPEILNHESSTLGHYPAGGAPNCRCDATPIVSLDQISWPARVYNGGSIRRMTRAQFAAFSGIQRRAA